jgi:hypothetical protein
MFFELWRIFSGKVDLRVVESFRGFFVRSGGVANPAATSVDNI